ncbi:KPN_02809 family neutral zinc metallopeptidase [Streptococcus ovis]|uniref:KPN_02809 family neutral zinc metallopeptidase n=1 Tax=Streptococcus ovis TaxID=82806 RepID=UPI000382A030|nr:neutral zinc metallopeptidase [Streptococcus ovis]
MKIDDLEQSRHVEDRRGQSGGSYGGSPVGGGSGMMGLLLQLLFSSGKGKWLIIAILAFSLLGGGVGLGDLLGLNATQSNYETNYSPSEVSDEDAVFISKVFNSTEDFWTQEFKKEGRTYHAPTLVIYDQQTPTGGCGVGSASAGPFYCSGDNKVYIDLTFYQDLSQKYGASGDFAMAYVIAHEVGHHVQNELGIMDRYNKERRGLLEKAANALNVRLELQADYYAGAWAHYVEGQGLLEMGDIEEAMNAAHAVGDDTLQEEAYGKSVPDSFTHGTSAQRQKWFNRGYQYGDIQHGDTFSENI